MKLRKGLLYGCTAFLHLRKYTLSQQTLACFLSENQSSPRTSGSPSSTPLRLAAHSQQSPGSDPAAHVLALARLHYVPERGADLLENSAVLSFSAGLFFRQSGSVVMQSHQLWCQHEGNEGNWPPRQVCCFLPGYELSSANREMSPLCVLPSLVSQIYKLVSFAYSHSSFLCAANIWVFIW